MAFLSERLISAGAKEDPVDDDFNLTTLLIHADGSNNGSNNQSGVSFLDTSDEGHAVIDANAAVFPGTFSPFSAEEGKWSGRFHRSHPDYFAFDNSDFAFGTGDFTIECWVYYVEAHQYGSGIFQPKDGVFGPALGQHSDDGWQIYIGTSSTDLADTDMPMREWVHIAYVRASNVVNVYQNGVKITSDISDSTNYTTTTFNIGKYYSDNFGMDGYISNFRVVKGTAVYTSNFTPPTEPLTAITNTVLLTCCSNRFRDKSTSGHNLLHSTTSAVNPMNSTNQPEARPFSPFAPSNAYSASTHGGSCFFSQTNNSEVYVSDATDFDFGTGDYTIEMWAYPTKTSFNNSWSMVVNTTGVNQYWAWTDGAGNANIAGLSTTTTNGYSVDFADIPEPFQWSHVVFQNTSGVANWYLNGTRIYNVTHNENTSASATGLHIGNSPHYSGMFQYGGHLTDIRVVKGSNAYTNGSTITVPTAPLTKITNTKLLLNFTQASIFDQTGKNNIRTAGGTHIDTSTKKFGTGSIEFDGTTDFLDIPSATFTPFGAGDFTVECFININSNTSSTGSSDAVIFECRANASTATGFVFNIRPNGTTNFKLNFYTDGSANLDGQTMNYGTWYHVAISRSGSTIRFFVNGTTTTNITKSNNFSDQPNVNIGYSSLYSNSGITGFIDEFRLTHKARYTSNFTAPTKAFPDK